ncbi:MAG: hypothetical protein VXX47_04185 [Pseudomonadota bacterium]|nr:hypothetical protein [Pseudomonadota bacterium]
MNQYGPALVVGLLIGGAILLDDVITPRHPHPAMMIEARDMGPLPMIRKEMRISGPSEQDDGPHKKVWIQKSGDGVIEMSEEMEIIVLADDSGSTKDVTLVEVHVDGESKSDLGDTVKAIVEKARAEGRKPSPDELRAAITDALGNGNEPKSVDVEIQIEESL